MIEKNIINPIYKRLENLCKKNNTKITPLCLEITGHRGNLDTWKKGNIRNDYLVKISEKFNVSTDYLLCRTDDPTPPGAESANDDEAELKRILAKIDSGGSKRGVLMQYGGNKRYIVDLSEEEFEHIEILFQVMDERKKRQEENKKNK